MDEAGETGPHTLRRALGPINLITLGVGAVVGIGIFVLTGIVSARYAGPAVILSFLLSALCCAFVGLCYAEFSSMIPIAGSAYTYGYATLGELVAWIIGWDLLLEYFFGAAMVAWGWSGYLQSLLNEFGVKLPPALAGTHWDEFVYYNGHWEDLKHILPTLKAVAIDPAALHHTHGIFNLCGFVVIVAVSAILVIGIKESAQFNTAIVSVNIFVLLFFILIGAHHLFTTPSLIASNWHPFIPTTTSFGHFGWSGISRAAAFLFFAYLGFDAVSTAAQEAKNPQKDMPIGLLGSLVISTILYVLFAAVLLGLVNYRNLDVANPLAVGIDSTGLHWGSLVVTLGALGTLSSTVVVLLLGGSRILFSMSNDGLLPRTFSKIHRRFRTPWLSSIIGGIFAAGLAATLPIDFLAEMVSIGTLLAFALVCVGVWVLRRRNKDIPRPFKTPWVPFVPIAGIAIILVLMASLTAITWMRLGLWFSIGLMIYFGYGRHHSRVQQQEIADRTGRNIGNHGAYTTPEGEFVSRILRGITRVFVIIIGIGALLGGLSTFIPSIDTHFATAAPVLSVLAIIIGFIYSFLPGIRTLWLLRKQQEMTVDDESEEIVRELIKTLREASDGSENKAKS
jgi:basic amino acid/polyamine antiporter, APA family